MHGSRRLALYHCWVAFAVFLPAMLLGAWQMLMRSPLPVPLDDSAAYYTSVTLHGTAMAYVVTTFFTMGFGYAVAATSLGRPVRGMTAAWVGFAICLVGTVMAVATILSGQARSADLGIDSGDRGVVVAAHAGARRHQEHLQRGGGDRGGELGAAGHVLDDAEVLDEDVDRAARPVVAVEHVRHAV